jgi:hypothetical protein
MRERILISGVNWQGALKQKGVKQGLGVQRVLAVNCIVLAPRFPHSLPQRVQQAKA